MDTPTWRPVATAGVHTPAAGTRPEQIEAMTGLTRDQVDDLVERAAAHGLWPLRRRRALDPRQAVVAVLLYLRHNLSQPLLTELFGCSQPTISRLVTLLLPVLTEVLIPITQDTAERELRSTVRVDGSSSRSATGAKTPTPPACTPESATAAGSTSRSSHLGTVVWS